jgi:hypothetical protein
MRMGIALFLGMLGCALLIAAGTRLALHELCHRFDGEKPRPPGRSSIPSYWLTFHSTDNVTFAEGKEAFHDRNANFATLASAMHGSIRVNTGRRARGQPPYTAIHGSSGMEWPLK